MINQVKKQSLSSNPLGWQNAFLLRSLNELVPAKSCLNFEDVEGQVDRTLGQLFVSGQDPTVLNLEGADLFEAVDHGHVGVVSVEHDVVGSGLEGTEPDSELGRHVQVQNDSITFGVLPSVFIIEEFVVEDFYGVASLGRIVGDDVGAFLEGHVRGPVDLKPVAQVEVGVELLGLLAGGQGKIAGDQGDQFKCVHSILYKLGFLTPNLYLPKLTFLIVIRITCFFIFSVRVKRSRLQLSCVKKPIRVEGAPWMSG